MSKGINNQQDYRRFLLDYARKCIKANSYSEADLALQTCQKKFPNHPVSYNLHAKMAFELNALPQAAQFAKHALKLAPNFTRAQENLALIERKLSQKQNVEPKEDDQQAEFLFIHSWGSGFGFELLYLLGQLLVAELSDRTPVIHWGGNSLYNQYASDPSYNAITDFFEPINSYTSADMQAIVDSSADGIFPRYWKTQPLNDFIRRTKWRDPKTRLLNQITPIFYLNRPEELLVAGEYLTLQMMVPWIPEQHRLFGKATEELYRDLFHRYLKPQKHIVELVEDFTMNALKGKPFKAIHLRGTDKRKERIGSDIDQINESLIAELHSLGGHAQIFLMTDDVAILSRMKEEFGERLVFADAIRGSESKVGGIHHQHSEKRRLGEDVLIDMLIASEADHFLGCGTSYLAAMINSIRPQGKSTLLPHNVLNSLINVPTPERVGKI